MHSGVPGYQTWLFGSCLGKICTRVSPDYPPRVYSGVPGCQHLVVWVILWYDMYPGTLRVSILLHTLMTPPPPPAF